MVYMPNLDSDVKWWAHENNCLMEHIDTV